MSIKLLLLASAVGVSPLAAQFEGVIHVRIGGATGSNTAMNAAMSVKGDRSVMTLAMPASAGPLAGADVRVIADPAAGTTTVLMPMPPGMPAMGNAKGMKMVMTTDDIVSDANATKGELKKLGTSQVVAGMKCADWELTMKNEAPVRMCLTDGMGRFMMMDITGRGRPGAQSMPKWAKRIYEDKLFPLKVWSGENDVAFEVTSVERKAIPASIFAVPSDYMDMSQMMGGMGRKN
ncbi:MAG: DUF4412 domain-containing protein [Gemmatimonadales bacterium]|nr:DUF4412 domain-containing protein [Gemmatimonadales bacterium]